MFHWNWKEYQGLQLLRVTVTYGFSLLLYIQADSNFVYFIPLYHALQDLYTAFIKKLQKSEKEQMNDN
jgi:hypothetical protein